MTAKEYLSEIQKKEEQVEDEAYYINQLRDSLISIGAITYMNDRIQCSFDNDKIGQIVAKLDSEEMKLKKMKEDFCFFRCHVISQIHSIEDMTLKQILMLRYVHWKDYGTLKSVAVGMGYSYKYVRELHINALSEFDRIFLQ